MKTLLTLKNIAGAIACIMLASHASAQVFDGGCKPSDLEKHEIIDANNNVVFGSQSAIAIAISDEVAMYAAADKATRTSSAKFGRKYYVVDPGRGTDMIQIQDLVDANISGWVSRDTLLCKLSPMRDSETGLWRRLYIQTATRNTGSAQDDVTQVAAEIEPKTLYRGPKQSCDDTCSTVGKFEWFFIYGDHNGRYLLAEGVSLAASASVGVRGWLQHEDGILWNTASALRPKIELDEREQNYLCAYKSVEEMRSGENCREFLGGMRWFDIDLRLPVLDETDEAWRVVFKGGGNNLDREALLREVSLAKVIRGLKNLDVTFVIDGTAVSYTHLTLPTICSV